MCAVLCGIEKNIGVWFYRLENSYLFAGYPLVLHTLWFSNMSSFCLSVLFQQILYIFASAASFFPPLRGCSKWPHWREQDWGWRCLRQSACHGVCTEGAGQLSSESERHGFTAHPGALRRWETGTSSLSVWHTPPLICQATVSESNRGPTVRIRGIPKVNGLSSSSLRLLSLPLINTFLFFTFNIRRKSCWNREVSICVREAWAGKKVVFSRAHQKCVYNIYNIIYTIHRVREDDLQVQKGYLAAVVATNP